MTYYDKISQGYDELHGEEQQNKARIILEDLKPKKEETLLDVGCGTGSYLDMFDCIVTGIDPAKELIRKYTGKHKLVLGSAERLPFPDNSFDIVISLTAIHNFEDIEKGLKEMRRVGKSRFALSILKRSPKFDWIEHTIGNIFSIESTVEEDKDVIFFCIKKA
jgi:ubiquinone/menaquinone biosynthesis C-methylase UbiE